MEAWATVALVLGSNAIMGLVNWFVTRMQIKHSEDELEKKQKAEREADTRERRREVRSEVVTKLRDQLAQMAVKGARVASIVTEAVLAKEELIEEFEGALRDWDSYMSSGEFQRALFMQYDLELADKAEEIRYEYNRARYKFWGVWLGHAKEPEKEKIQREAYTEVVGLIAENRRKIAQLQSRINKLLEQL